ncbi:LysR substrate-binding domain-containing protein [Georgenia halophila]|uniref:LysR substrate-binding domain-containing protein n=1 Tax=Georgenia halophila TaxID=620889 RepID=A0ABP8LMV1_9MICO
MSVPFTLRQLEYFEAVASEGSLAAASERCHVSASALALALDDLERHLALQLLVRRKGRGVTLTPAGSRVLSLARQLLAGAETLTADAWQTATSLTGRFSVGCFSTLTPFYLPAILEDFGRRHPALELELVEAGAPELHELLLQGRVDAALMYSVDVSAQLAFERVHTYRPHVLVPDGHPLADRGGIQLGELVSEPLIVLDVHPTRQNTEQLFGALSLEPTIGHTTGSFELVRCLVGRGLGYAVMFQRPATSWSYDGHQVRHLEITDRVPSTVVGLARPVGAPRTARYGALLDFLSATGTSSAPVHAAR